MTRRRLAIGRSDYFSDLTDAEWREVRETALAGHPDPDPLRQVVNALVYRERALCPWELLPPEFPPPAALRPHFEQWTEDGTWEKVRAVVDRAPEQDPPAWPALDRARRAVARTLRRLPGGEWLLRPGRWAIQFCQYAASRFTVEAKLPGWFVRAYYLMREKEYAAAADLYTRILEVDPLNTDSRLERAAAYLQLGRPADAVADCRRVLSCPDSNLWHVAQAHAYLGRGLALSGDPDRGIRHWFQAKLLHLYGPAAPWDGDQEENDPDWFELLAETHSEVAEYLINMKGDFTGAIGLYRRMEEVGARYAGWLATAPRRTLFLTDDWVRSIGHIALLDCWVKMIRMGWVDRDRIILLAPPQTTANAAFLEYFKPLVHVRGARITAAARHLSVALGPRVATAVTLPDGTRDYFCNALGVVQEAWEARGGKPLLSLTEEDRAFGEKTLRKMGVPAGAWFVAIHVRAPGFYKEQGNQHQAHRNADIQSYLPALREVVRRGGWVIRMGDRTMDPLPPTPGVVDYALGPFKSPRMDVFLCGACKFFIGVTSGMCHVPPTFGVPVLNTNWMSNVPLAIFNGPDVCLPKLLYSDREGRTLTFRERFTEPVAGWCHSGEALRDQGLRAVDNTPEELREAVAEMLDRLDRVEVETDADRALYARYEELLRSIGVRGAARIGQAFLRAHADLLADPGSGRAAA